MRISAWWAWSFCHNSMWRESILLRIECSPRNGTRFLRYLKAMFKLFSVSLHKTPSWCVCLFVSKGHKKQVGEAMKSKFGAQRLHIYHLRDVTPCECRLGLALSGGSAERNETAIESKARRWVFFSWLCNKSKWIPSCHCLSLFYSPWTQFTPWVKLWNELPRVWHFYSISTLNKSEVSLYNNCDGYLSFNDK